MVLIATTAVVLFSAAFAALRPLPPRQIAMATGPSGSTHARVAEQYRKILARDGVRIRLVPTNGAVENVKLLRDPHSGVGAGFVQAGSVTEDDARDLVSLGSVFYQALWVFCRCAATPATASEVAQQRISIGPVGSADRPLALKVLVLLGYDPQQLQLFAYPPEDAARALLAKQVDIVGILSGWDSPVVQSLARAPDITLRSFRRADAYVALNPYLTKLVLPRGVADLASDRPPEDTILIGSKASLAVRNDLHPAIQYLLVRAAMDVHSHPGMFERAGEFPAAEPIDLPLSAEARTLYRSGPTFLQRNLPFWLGELVQRLLILVLPIVGIVYPLWSLGPRLYYWQMRRRLYPIHRELKWIERQLQDNASDKLAAFARRIDELDARALNLQLPAALSDSLYTLRGHIVSLRERVLGKSNADTRESKGTGR